MRISSIWDSLKRQAMAAPLLALTLVAVLLAGATYAGSKLPHRSVGPAQLKDGAVVPRVVRDGAVKPRALAVPVGQAFRSSRMGAVLVMNAFCINAELPSGEPAKCAPPMGPQRVLHLKVAVKRRGFLRVDGLVNLDGSLQPGFEHGTAEAWARIEVDGEKLDQVARVTVDGDHHEVLPILAWAPVEAGVHEVSLVLEGESFDHTNLVATSASVAGTVLPSVAR